MTRNSDQTPVRAQDGRSDSFLPGVRVGLPWVLSGRRGPGDYLMASPYTRSRPTETGRAFVR